PYLVTTLRSHLDNNERVVWLIPGGSAIDTAIQVADFIKDHPKLANLSVTLTDERFGPVGHADENWQQLIESGFLLPGATTYRVLTGNIAEETARLFAEKLEE